MDLFHLDVGDSADSYTQQVAREGVSPLRWGSQMLAVEEGAHTTVQVTITNVGEALMVQGTVSGQATGRCARCLASLTPTVSVTISGVFGLTPDFIDGDEAEEGDEPMLVEDNTVDISQLVIDEGGLTMPFSPLCEDFGLECEATTPPPHGVVDGEPEEQPPIDPRWAGLAALQFDEDL